MNLESAIIDVGASNVEEFLKLMQRYSSSHEEFDYFVIPVVKERKQQVDTMNTIRALAELGIPKNKIRLVFNIDPLKARLRKLGLQGRKQGLVIAAGAAPLGTQAGHQQWGGYRRRFNRHAAMIAEKGCRPGARYRTA